MTSGIREGKTPASRRPANVRFGSKEDSFTPHDDGSLLIKCGHLDAKFIAGESRSGRFRDGVGDEGFALDAHLVPFETNVPGHVPACGLTQQVTALRRNILNLLFELGTEIDHLAIGRIDGARPFGLSEQRFAGADANVLAALERRVSLLAKRA